MAKRSLAAALLSVILLSLLDSPAAEANPEVCRGDWSMGIGGLQLSLTEGGWDDSRYLVSDQPVGYDSLNPRAGMAELDRLYWRHRAQCPGDRVTIIGHSEGAGIAHAWVSANQFITDTNVILLADPKQWPHGLSGDPLAPVLGYPLAGVDANFGSVPVLQVCHPDDVVCNEPAGWMGYLFTRAHTSYDMNVNDY